VRLLLIHADRISYHAKEAIKNLAEELTAVPDKDSMEQALVAFCSVEKGDEKDTDAVIENAVRSIREHTTMVKTQRVFVYPYAHLSDELSAPKHASQTLVALADRLKKEGFEVKRAPFGWYKSFELNAKGHPLAELSRTITAEGAAKGKKAAAAASAAVPTSRCSIATRRTRRVARPAASPRTCGSCRRWSSSTTSRAPTRATSAGTRRARS
jgi:threonyl-tRNA synthetase